MPGDDLHMFNGVLPYDNIEGSDALILGNFINFVNHLFSLSKDLVQPRSLGQWQISLTALIDRFFRPDEQQERELYFLRHLLDHLVTIETNANLRVAVSLTVIKSHLKSKLDQNSYGAGFLTGGVTFCAMLPMRRRCSHARVV